MGIIEQELAASPESMKEFQRGRLELELTELICDLMEEQEVTRAELARRLGTSRAYVTKVLRDGSNMTVRTIADIFSCLGRSLRLVCAPPVDPESPTPGRRSPALDLPGGPHAGCAPRLTRGRPGIQVFSRPTAIHDAQDHETGSGVMAKKKASKGTDSGRGSESPKPPSRES